MPVFQGFVGGDYPLVGPNISPERSMNLFVESLEQGPRAGQKILRNIPGLPTFKTIATRPLRALWSNATRCFAIGGNTLWEIFNDGRPDVLVGVIKNATTPATITSNGTSLAIASGNSAYLALGVGVGIIPLIDTTGAPINASSIAFLGQYFIAAIAGTRLIMVSNLAPDGGTWDPANVATKEAYSDNIVRVWVDDPGGQYLWLFGDDTTEIWTQTADLFPFSRIQGGVLSIGCDAPWSVAGVAGNRFWLWHETIWWATGFSPQRVSDYAVEQAISSYSDLDRASAEGFSYIHEGHVNYAISFPISGKTHVFDLKEKAWHQRAYFSNGQFSRYRPRVTTVAFGGKHLMGDYDTGDIYELDENTFTDAHGVPLVRDRITSYITDEMKNVRYNKLTIDMDTGIGLPVAPGQPGYDPQVIMRYSNNRGKNWSDERTTSAGRLGETNRRVVFNQLGSSRIGLAVWLRMTDPVPTSYNGAYIDIGQSIIQGVQPGQVAR